MGELYLSLSEINPAIIVCLLWPETREENKTKKRMKRVFKYI